MARKKIPVKAAQLSVADWVPLNEAFARIKAALASSDLASRDLLNHLRSGRLPSAMRCIARDDVETSGELEASFWQQVTLREGLKERSGKVAVLFLDPRSIVTFSSWYFVARPELDKLYPAGGARLDHDDSSDMPPPIKPGPKPRGDWPTLVAQWLIEVAVDDPSRLQNVDVLVIEAQNFLDNQIEWSPSNTKKLRAKIVELLRFVRR